MGFSAGSDVAKAIFVLRCRFAAALLGDAALLVASLLVHTHVTPTGSRT